MNETTSGKFVTFFYLLCEVHQQARKPNPEPHQVATPNMAPCQLWRRAQHCLKVKNFFFIPNY
jgi:hypothetical protein